MGEELVREGGGVAGAVGDEGALWDRRVRV
jgi:hypothetical protein